MKIRVCYWLLICMLTGLNSDQLQVPAMTDDFTLLSWNSVPTLTNTRVEYYISNCELLQVLLVTVKLNCLHYTELFSVKKQRSMSYTIFINIRRSIYFLFHYIICFIKSILDYIDTMIYFCSQPGFILEQDKPVNCQNQLILLTKLKFSSFILVWIITILLAIVYAKSSVPKVS